MVKAQTAINASLELSHHYRARPCRGAERRCASEDRASCVAMYSHCQSIDRQPASAIMELMNSPARPAAHKTAHPLSAAGRRAYSTCSPARRFTLWQEPGDGKGIAVDEAGNEVINVGRRAG